LLVQPEDTRVSLEKIREELAKINKHFEKVDNDRVVNELTSQYKRDKNIFQKIWGMASEAIQKYILKK
jgi:hypothetical protein